jgi:hypothetical protein
MPFYVRGGWVVERSTESRTSSDCVGIRSSSQPALFRCRYVCDRNRMILPCLPSDKLASGCGRLRALDAKRLIHNVVFAHLERTAHPDLRGLVLRRGNAETGLTHESLSLSNFRTTTTITITTRATTPSRDCLGASAPMH